MTGWRLLLVTLLVAFLGGCAALGQQAIRLTGPGGWGIAYEWGRSNDAAERAQANAGR